MTTTQTTTTQPRQATPYAAAEFVVALLLLLAAVASVIGGFVLADSEKRSSVWIAGGVVEAVGFLAVAAIIYLLREIAVNTRR